MLATTPLVVFPALTPDGHRPHSLHDAGRDWPETNCYIDVWIEVLSAMGEDPTAALGFTVAQDFEGDHFTFMKFPLEDLAEQFGLEVGELALYDTLEVHLVEQIRRGRLVLLEVDGFHLPDTRGISYGIEHTKTTIAVNRIDPRGRTLDYFHGGGVHAMGADDYAAVLQIDAGAASLFPYAEFVKFDARRRLDASTSVRILRRHLARRPASNPVAAFRERVHDQAMAAAARPNGFLHKYAFNTARQLGMNFELLGSHLRWLTTMGAGWTTLGTAVESCEALSAGAKVFQFQLARAVARGRFDGLETKLDALVDHYDRVFLALEAI